MIFKIYCIGVLVVSLLTFCVYGIDKRKAKKEKRRISEKTLLTMSFLGGAIGGFLAMLKFRHKTKGEHWYFYFINIVSIILHVGLGIYLFTL